MKGRIRNLLDRDVGGRELVDEPLAPGAGREIPGPRNGRSARRCGETIGPPPRPGSRVNSVATTSTPRARAAWTNGTSRAGSAAIDALVTPARP
jgi:hypothetical protein